MLRNNTGCRRLCPFFIAELVLKPADHPVAAEYFDFRYPTPGIGRAICGQEADRFRVAVGAYFYRRRRTEAEGRGFRIEASHTERFACLITAAGDNRYTGRKPCFQSALGGNPSDLFPALHNAAFFIIIYRKYLRRDVSGRCPLLLFMIKGNVSDQR